MAFVLSHREPSPHSAGLPPLEPGDHLDRATFHARYEAMPSGIKAELIEGVVFIPSPAKSQHGSATSTVNAWLKLYAIQTPGTAAYDNVTVLLSENSEPQPDACLILLPECGGQAQVDEEDWITGPPELVVEVASSSESYDLHPKKRVYETAGVREYVTVLLREGAVRWFVLRNGRYEELAPGSDRVFRSEVFPGLWLDAEALLQSHGPRFLEVLQQGLDSEEHTRFVSRLGPASE